MFVHLPFTHILTLAGGALAICSSRDYFMKLITFFSISVINGQVYG